MALFCRYDLVMEFEKVIGDIPTQFNLEALVSTVYQVPLSPALVSASQLHVQCTHARVLNSVAPCRPVSPDNTLQLVGFPFRFHFLVSVVWNFVPLFWARIRTDSVS